MLLPAPFGPRIAQFSPGFISQEIFVRTRLRFKKTSAFRIRKKKRSPCFSRSRPLEWTARDDGHGFEIKGVSGDMMRLFSSRRASITADLRERAVRFEQRYGRAPIHANGRWGGAALLRSAVMISTDGSSPTICPFATTRPDSEAL